MKSAPLSVVRHHRPLQSIRNTSASPFRWATPLHRVPSANSTQWVSDLKVSSKLLNFFVSHNMGSSTGVYHQTFLLDAASWLLLGRDACVLDPEGVVLCFFSWSSGTLIGDFPGSILLVFTSAGGVTVAVTLTMAAPRLSPAGFRTMTFQPTFETYNVTVFASSVSWT